MKDLFFNALWFLGLALIVVLIVTIITALYAYVGIFLKKIAGPECSHNYRQMTDKVGSPIKCLDCGKIVE